MLSIVSKKTALLAGVAALGLTLSAPPAGPARAADPFLAQIVMFGGNFAPRGWALCDGQLLPISSNSALFSILGTTNGGDGRTTFALPDMRGRVSMHPGSGPGLSTRRLGERGGTQANALTVNQMPPPIHSAVARVNATNARGNADVPAGNIWARKARDNDYSEAPPDVVMSSSAVNVTVGSAGGGQAVNNVLPFLAVNYIIALQGTFPSRD